MKTYLPQIERRILVRPNQTFGILNYDMDNAYPQRMLELVAASPTAKDCWNKRAKFIAGNGFEQPGLGRQVVNAKGLTLAKLLKAVATDKALFTGFGIHVNYNANFKIVSVNYVKFEDIRLGDTDCADTANKYAIYSDWGRKTWKNIMRSKITFLDKYDPDQDAIKQQVVAAGGWENYKGQLYYFNPEVDDYPLIEADSVWEDFETEAGIKIFNNREVTTGFLPSTMLFMQSRREEADNSNPDDDERAWNNSPSQLEKDLGTFQGAKSAQKIIVIEYEDEASKPEFQPYSIQNNDKLFEATERSVEARIIKGFSVPKELINSESTSGLSNGGEKREAIREFNDNTAPERLELTEAFAAIFSNYYREINPANNWNIVPVPANAADDLTGLKAGTSINQLLLANLPAQNKIATLVYVYGFKQAEAEAMVS
jgi:subtilisin family serine protease